MHKPNIGFYVLKFSKVVSAFTFDSYLNSLGNSNDELWDTITYAYQDYKFSYEYPVWYPEEITLA